MRGLWKGAVEASLCKARIPALIRGFRATQTLVLAYHNIVPTGCVVTGDRSLHLNQSAFALQLDLLRRTHDIVPLTALETAGSDGRRPRAVITFDDAYQGTLTAGLEELERRALPATVFVAPVFVGGHSFWWDEVGHTGKAADEFRSHALGRLQGRDNSVRDWATARGIELRAGPQHQLCATESQLQSTAGTGITLGSHSWSHPNLPTLSHEELRRELASSRAWLTERYSNVVDWLAYPYGRYSPQVMEAARAAGYSAAVRVDGGWVRRSPISPTAAFATPRENIPAGISLRGFELRISGFSG